MKVTLKVETQCFLLLQYIANFDELTERPLKLTLSAVGCFAGNDGQHPGKQRAGNISVWMVTTLVSGGF